MRVMTKLRTKFYTISFTARFIMSLVWTFAALLCILGGVKVDRIILLGIPVLMLIALIIGKNRMRRPFRIWVIAGMMILFFDVIANAVDIYTVIVQEIIIILVGPVFFKEHAK